MHTSHRFFFTSYTVKPRKFKHRFIKMLVNSKLICDTLDSENRTYRWLILLTVSNNICFGCVKETSPSDISFTHPKLMFDRKLIKSFLGVIYFYVYRSIIQITDNSK